jgi:hypothetical protein
MNLGAPSVPSILLRSIGWFQADFTKHRWTKSAARVQKKSSSENSAEDFPKNQIGQLMSPVIGRASPLFQPEIPWWQQELRIQRDSSRQSSQAQWSELALSQA